MTLVLPGQDSSLTYSIVSIYKWFNSFQIVTLNSVTKLYLRKYILERAKPLFSESDLILVSRVIARDADAFALLYDRYANAVFAVAAHMLGRDEAEGVVQDVFLRLWDHAAQYDPTRGSFRSWFMSVARNRMRDKLRQQRTREKIARVAEIENRIIEESQDELLLAVTEVEDNHLLLKALQTLPELQRQAIFLAYFGGLTHQAIADELNWPLGTVKKRIQLGITKLRNRLLPLNIAYHGSDIDGVHE